MSTLARLFFRITGGRPMKREGFALFDYVAQKGIFYYRDRDRGVRWMAEGAWSLFRVRSVRQ